MQQNIPRLKNEGLTNAGTPPVPAPGTPARGFFTQNDANGKLIDTRWYDMVYRTGISQNHSVNVSGATTKPIITSLQVTPTRKVCL